MRGNQGRGSHRFLQVVMQAVEALFTQVWANAASSGCGCDCVRRQIPSHIVRAKGSHATMHCVRQVVKGVGQASLERPAEASS